jgi:hypothetical protein
VYHGKVVIDETNLKDFMAAMHAFEMIPIWWTYGFAKESIFLKVLFVSVSFINQTPSVSE